MLIGKNQIGVLGEKIAQNYLSKNGYEILEKNVRLKNGELDIICQRQGKLFFIEVKTRTSRRFGLPEESITSEKCLKLANLTCEYIENNGLERMAYQIDIIAIELFKNNSNSHYLRHLKNIADAFDDGKLDDINTNR